MFTIKKTILSIAAVASSVILLSSCGSSEIVNPNLASEIGVAKVSGKFKVNTNFTNDEVTITGMSVETVSGTTTGLGSGVYITSDTEAKFDNVFPAGKVTFTVTYKQSTVNPVSSSNPASNLFKAITVTVNTDGTYSFEVPASGKGTAITITAIEFEDDFTYYKNTNVTGSKAKVTIKQLYKTTLTLEDNLIMVYPGSVTLPVQTYKSQYELDLENS